MKEVDRYVEKIVSDLPMEEKEKKEFREELNSHLHEHINELMIKGFSEKEAVRHALQSFGNNRQLNREMEAAMFPIYKVVRFTWNLIFLTVFLSAVSYFSMEYYHPEFDNSLPLSVFPLFMIIILLITLAAETIYETVNSRFKSKWLANPWIFFMVPSLIIGALSSLLWFENPGKYQDGYWIDLFLIPIGAVGYLTARQLFNLVFLRNKKEYQIKKAKE